MCNEANPKPTTAWRKNWAKQIPLDYSSHIPWPAAKRKLFSFSFNSNASTSLQIQNYTLKKRGDFIDKQKMNNAGNGIRPKTQIEERRKKKSKCKRKNKIHTFCFFEPRIHFEFRIPNNCALFHQPVGDRETNHTAPHTLNFKNEMLFSFSFFGSDR